MTTVHHYQNSSDFLISVKIKDPSVKQWAAEATLYISGVVIDHVPIKVVNGSPGLYPVAFGKQVLQMLDENSKETIRRAVHYKYMEYAQGHLKGTPLYEQAC